MVFIFLYFFCEGKRNSKEKKWIGYCKIKKIMKKGMRYRDNIERIVFPNDIYIYKWILYIYLKDIYY